jgi:hypothetical protein
MVAKGVAHAFFTASAAVYTFDSAFCEHTFGNIQVDTQLAYVALVQLHALDLNIVRALSLRCSACVLEEFQDALLGNKSVYQLPAYSTSHYDLPLA